jgi:hypothetical protein
VAIIAAPKPALRAALAAWSPEALSALSEDEFGAEGSAIVGALSAPSDAEGGGGASTALDQIGTRSIMVTIVEKMFRILFWLRLCIFKTPMLRKLRET